ncbi:MAG: hypothetical protein VKJ46_04355 [Leptolyngbyaceae bacterium]|nr:hypothetical protein [Leptolyngbyaceae bacterium]
MKFAEESRQYNGSASRINTVLAPDCCLPRSNGNPDNLPEFPTLERGTCPSYRLRFVHSCLTPIFV